MAISLLLLSGCRSNKAEKNVIQDFELNDSHVNAEIIGETKQLIINADTSPPYNLNGLKTFSVSVSQKYFDNLASTLITDHYDNVIRENKTKYYVLNEDRVRIGITMDEAGYLSFVDTEKDISGSFIGNPFRYNYFVDGSGCDIGISQEQAIEECKNFISGYSDLDFFPYRTIVETNNARQTPAAHYRIFLQPVYNGIPICIRTNSGSLGADLSIGKNGISSARGVFLFDHVTEGKITNIVSMEEAIETLCSGIDYYLVPDTGEVYYISLEYYAEYKGSNTYSFQPVWMFYGFTGEYYWIIGFNANDCSFGFSASM